MLKLPFHLSFVNDNVFIIKNSFQIPASRKRFDIRCKEAYGPILHDRLKGNLWGKKLHPLRRDTKKVEKLRGEAQEELIEV